MAQVTCLHIFQYSGWSTKFWAFKMMQFAHPHLQQIDGLEFYKLMGSGKDFGFNPLPDWSTYALLSVWENETKANTFFDSSELFQRYKNKCSDITCHYMTCIKTHGYWSKKQPFQEVELDPNSNKKIGVITRATIKKRHLLRFWKYVPTSTYALKNNPNLLYTKGIGEVPIVQMATFSIWKNMEAIKEFAYKGKHHREAIQMTKKYNWYKEEMFSRFEIYKTKSLLME
ncbi:MAG: hypothetical protein P1U56_12380 [Saprospiraceae bacterium]|nr:hypothetical protein [Saprospiraceae bacterium]